MIPPCPTPPHSGIAVLNIENELTKNIDYDEVVDIFKTIPSLRDAALAAGDSMLGVLSFSTVINSRP